MSALSELIGVEREMSHVSWALREFAQRLGASSVGAHHVLCSDEAEWECADAFQRWFASGVLPELKPACRAPFHTVNLGARYEWGSLHVANEHFARGAARDGFTLMVVKINSHVAVRATAEGIEYGRLSRYQRESACCGALAAMLEGSSLPSVAELARSFVADGLHRLALLRDTVRVPVAERALRAALANALLQARRAAEDAQSHRAESPTVYLILPCVTINRPGPDTEIVAGQWGIDATHAVPEVKYQGLGDDPAAWRVRHVQHRAVIEDGHWPPA